MHFAAIIEMISQLALDNVAILQRPVKSESHILHDKFENGIERTKDNNKLSRGHIGGNSSHGFDRNAVSICGKFEVDPGRMRIGERTLPR